MMSAAFARDVAARAARIVEALADGETWLALDIAVDLEEDALRVAVDFERDPVVETGDGLADELPEAA